MAKTSHPIRCAALGIAALVCIALLVNWISGMSSLGRRGIDFSEHQVHSLSGGTKAILEELRVPVTLRYYASRDVDFMPERLKMHRRRVDALLADYAQLASRYLVIEHLDPKPDTDAEDAAKLDGISGQKINDETIFLGLAIDCLGETAYLPFLDPRDEMMLEYRISNAIAQLSAASSPRLGFFSGLGIASNEMMRGQQATKPWRIVQQIQKSYQFVNVVEDLEALDPIDCKALLVMHPIHFIPAVVYAIDQYVLRGGTVILCLDANALTAKLDPNSNLAGPNKSPSDRSNIPELLKAWGVGYDERVIADPSYATAVDHSRKSMSILTLGKGAIVQPDNVITKHLNGLTLYLPGSFYPQADRPVHYQSLIRASDRAGYVDAEQAFSVDPRSNIKVEAPGHPCDLMVHLSGDFKTAFPDGKPDAARMFEKEGEPARDHLMSSTASGNVFLIADVDAFYDQFAYGERTVAGKKIVSPVNPNSSFLMNLIDGAMGSKHLLGARARAASKRPFDVINRMDDEFKRQFGSQVEAYEAKRQELQKNLAQLQATRTGSGNLYLTPEQEKQISGMRAELVKYSRLIREQQNDLKRKKDKLTGRLTLINVAALPGLVALIGLACLVIRRYRTGPV